MHKFHSLDNVTPPFVRTTQQISLGISIVTASNLMINQKDLPKVAVQIESDLLKTCKIKGFFCTPSPPYFALYR